MYISLSDIKEHLILDDSFNSDDNYLISLISVAEAAIENVINQPLQDISDDGILPTPINHCIKLLVANYYENREPLSSNNLYNNAYGLEYLMNPYKKY